MIFFGQVLLCTYGVLLIVGGVMGFRAAGSRISLYAGAITGGLSVGAAWLSLGRPADGFTFGGLIAFLMTGVFINRFVKTRKFMPAGVVLILSLIVGMAMLWIVQRLGTAPTGIPV